MIEVKTQGIKNTPYFHSDVEIARRLILPGELKPTAAL
jgi:hypothetical protein